MCAPATAGDEGGLSLPGGSGGEGAHHDSAARGLARGTAGPSLPGGRNLQNFCSNSAEAYELHVSDGLTEGNLPDLEKKNCYQPIFR